MKVARPKGACHAGFFFDKGKKIKAKVAELIEVKASRNPDFIGIQRRGFSTPKNLMAYHFANAVVIPLLNPQNHHSTIIDRKLQ